MTSLFKISAVFFTVVTIISARLICHLSNCRLNLICKGSFTLVVVCSTVFLSKKHRKKKLQGRKRDVPGCHFCCRRCIFFRCRWVSETVVQLTFIY